MDQKFKMDKMWWIVIIAVLALSESSHGIYSTHDEFLASLNDYTIVIPSRVSLEGNHVSYSLHPGHSLRRRSANNFVQSTDTKDTLHYSVDINNKQHVLQLTPNYNLVSPGFVIERKKNRFKNVTDSTFSRLHESKTNCHFHGHVRNQSNTRVAVGLCNGLHGFIHTEEGQFFIEPLNPRPLSPGGKHRHVIYKRSAVPDLLDPARVSAHVHKRDAEGDDSCGVHEFEKATAQRERWELHQRQRRDTSSMHRRRKRSFSTERYVETLVVVDPSMIKYHKNEHLETYVLTIMNMVSAMFYDASIGNSINIVLVRILLMEDEQEELVITHHADKTLQSFCKFQKKINFKDDDHPNHHDVAILLTRKNICSRLDEPCGTLGLAEVSGMCQPHRSCSISEDTGLALAYTVTHELGHNFGMHHDGHSNGCIDPPGHQLYIMSPSLVADSLSKSWSNCSKNAITTFIDRDWGYCLDDEPASHNYKFPVLPPGTMYDADHQCRLQYGNDNASICGSEQDVCSNLWCRTDNKCSTHLEAAAEGTICGSNKWCYEGRCVKIGDRPEAINGEWGEWTSWTECSRTCGAGVSHSMRHCANPAPSHGGKYCLGERKRYRICNTEECQDDSLSFNSAQCSEFNYMPYKGRLYEWEHVPTSETPCQLHCKPKTHFFSVLLKDIVTDGTKCTPGTRNMCITGRCRHIGCDYAIDSPAKEDRCGVCHGDGSTCTTVKSQYNESQGLGYVEAAIIPVGARNIRVEEVAEANNFLALQNDKGEYFLNGHWFIQWSGDYKAAGTIIQYERQGNKESVLAAGPLKEPLHVMLLLQSSNPGVEFEYTVPKSNISELREPEFHWIYQPWTHCTASCGGGSQRSGVVCTELEAGIVEDKYCKHNVSAKPDDRQRVCNEHLCPARWWTGPWQHCTVTCGNNGIHQRTVICVRSLGPDEQIALDDDACEADEKPAEMESCNKKEPCPGNSTWVVGDWSDCNGNACGLKYRTITCKDPSIGCESNTIPASEGACTDVPCGEWAATNWSKCTSSCGDGVQVREVWCEGADFCDTRHEPHMQQTCSRPPCPIEVPETNQLPTDVHQPATARPTPLDSDTVARKESNADTELMEVTKSTAVTDSKFTEGVDDTKHETSAMELDKEENAQETIQTEAISNDDSLEDVEETTYKESESHSQSEHNSEGINSNLVKEHDSFAIEIEEFDTSKAHDVETKVPVTVNQDKTGENEGFESKEDNEVDNYKDASVDDTTVSDETSVFNVQIQDFDKTDESEDGKAHDQENAPVEGKVSNKGNVNKQPENGEHESESDREETVKESVKKSGDDNDEEDYDITEENFDEKGDPDNTANDKNSDIDNEDKTAVNKKVHIPKLPVPTGNIRDFNEMPVLPDKANLPPLPKLEDLGTLPELKDLPPLKHSDLHKMDGKDFMSFPKAEKLPNLGDLPPLPGTLPKLPKKSDLPKIGDMPLLRNMDNKLDKISEAHAEDIAVEKPSTMHNNDKSEIPHDETQPGEIKPAAKTSEINNHKLPQKDTIKPTEQYVPDRPVNNKEEPVNNDKIRDEIKPFEHDNFDMDHVDFSMDKLESLKKDLIDMGQGSMPMLKPMSNVDIGKHKWMPADWTECSRLCGGGVRTRVVLCVDKVSSAEVMDQFSCDINTKPTAIEDCNQKPCLNWVTTDWGQCSSSCGYSVRRRPVTCPVEGSCDPKSKPINEERCDIPECVVWVSGPWNRCNKKCGGGEQLRLVQCVNTTSQRPSRGCDYSNKPTERRDCNRDPCTDRNAALSITCAHNEMSSIACRALKKMGQCHKRFVALKCCRTCSANAHKLSNKYRPRGHSLR